MNWDGIKGILLFINNQYEADFRAKLQNQELLQIPDFSLNSNKNRGQIFYPDNDQIQ